MGDGSQRATGMVLLASAYSVVTSDAGALQIDGVRNLTTGRQFPKVGAGHHGGSPRDGSPKNLPAERAPDPAYAAVPHRTRLPRHPRLADFLASRR